MSSIEDDSDALRFAKKLKFDENLTKKPDWAVSDILRRLTYSKKNKEWRVKADKISLFNSLHTVDIFQRQFKNASHMFCCIKTSDLKSQTNDEKLRDVSFIK